MHELALMESLVATVEGGVEQGRVTRVCLEVGRLHAAVPDALRFCFDVCARGTRLEGAGLDIVEIAPRARCSGCGVEHEVDGFVLPDCSCGGGEMTLSAGRELRIREVEVI